MLLFFAETVEIFGLLWNDLTLPDRPGVLNHPRNAGLVEQRGNARGLPVYYTCNLMGIRVHEYIVQMKIWVPQDI